MSRLQVIMMKRHNKIFKTHTNNKKAKWFTYSNHRMSKKV